MSTTFSMLKLINAALLAHGQETVSVNDGSLEWRVLSDNWPIIVEAELEASNFHFTKEEATVTSYVTGKFGFDYGYQVPPGALHVRNVWVEDASGIRHDVDWCQDATHVYLDFDEGCVIEYVDVTDVAVWTANFSMGIQLRLEAIVLRSLKEEYGEARKFDERAEAFLQRARTKSSTSRSKNPAIKGKGSIVEARLRRG
jgi:hypothetical protein